MMKKAWQTRAAQQAVSLLLVLSTAVSLTACGRTGSGPEQSPAPSQTAEQEEPAPEQQEQTDPPAEEVAAPTEEVNDGGIGKKPSLLPFEGEVEVEPQAYQAADPNALSARVLGSWSVSWMQGIFDGSKQKEFVSRLSLEPDGSFMYMLGQEDTDLAYFIMGTYTIKESGRLTLKVTKLHDGMNDNVETRSDQYVYDVTQQEDWILLEPTEEYDLDGRAMMEPIRHYKEK